MKQTLDDLQNQLNDQIEFLKLSAQAYDRGFESESKRMATTIRILLHDTLKSHSLLGQLNLKDTKFLSTCVKPPKLSDNQQLVGGYAGLVGLLIGDAGGYVPNFDSSNDITGYIDFENYWSEIIFNDKLGNSYSRKDIVLAVANQDGGSHVDPELNEKYASLSRSNSLGWVSRDYSDKWIPVKGAELAAIRQITHELLRTLVPDYPKKQTLSNRNGFVIGGQGIILNYE